MKTGRDDYDAKLAGVDLFEPDEPVFILRARDVTAPDIIRAWFSRHVTETGNLADPIAISAAKHMQAMLDWQNKARREDAEATALVEAENRDHERQGLPTLPLPRKRVKVATL